MVGAQPDDRTRFLAVIGLGLSALSLVTVIGAGVPRFVLDPCM
jgi:hypothetical protein